MPKLEQLNLSHLNARLAKVLKQPPLQFESKYEIAIGRQHVKNTQIQSRNEFEKYVDWLNPYQSSTKEFKISFLQLNQRSKVKVNDRELEG